MNIMSIVGFFTALFNIGSWIDHPLYTTLLFFDRIAYETLAYSFSVFQIVCTLNFNSIYGIIASLVARIESVVLVFVVFKLGLTFIGFMLNPEEAAKKGKDILVSIFVAGALLLSYNFIFTFFNELSMLIVGNPGGYEYVVLKQVADVKSDKDVGLIVRFIFGDAKIDDIGNYLAYSTASIFIVDATDETKSTIMTGEICDGNGHCDFSKLTNLASKVGKSVTYHPLLGFLCACFMVYTIFKAAIQIGVRMFKMMIMQLIAPIAITAIVGEGMKSQTFQRFVKTYFSVYIEAFIRMFAMFLVSVFVCKFFVNIGDFFAEIDQDDWFATALVTIIIILAAYKFAGDIPAFLDKFIGKQFFAGKENKNFIGGILGAGLGFLSGLSTGTIAGTISGLTGGFSQGAKGNTIADLIKGTRANAENARNVGANARMAGGSLRYGLARAGGMLGIPQRRAERGKLAGEKQQAMDNMVKNLEDYYDGKAVINGSKVGLNRDIFRTYAYDKDDDNRFYYDLSDDTRDAVDETNRAEKAYQAANGVIEAYRTQGVWDQSLNGGKGDYRAANNQEMGEAWAKVESTRTAYQNLKASSDKKVDTDYNSKMLRDARRHPLSMVKKKGRSAVRGSIATYDNVADIGYSSRRIARRRGGATTKTAGDRYTGQQNRANYNSTVRTWNNSNTRGGGGSSGGSSK